MENFNDQVQKSLDANWIQRISILGLRMGLRNILLSCWIKKYGCKLDTKIFYFVFAKWV